MKTDFFQGLMFWKLRREVAEVQQQLAEMRGELAGTQQQMVGIRSEVTSLQQQFTGLREGILALRYHTWSRSEEPPPEVAQLKEVIPISEQFYLLQQLAPHAFAVWHPLLEVNKRAYLGFPIDSCSVPGHPIATLFRFFLAPYLKGRVLDIGCGSQAIPTYLEDYLVDAIYGVDPLSQPEDHPFHFINGFAEFLPWADNQFNLVIAATSLDHVLLLDKVFGEIHRVLATDGFFVVWDGFIPGSKPYNPYRQDIEKVDDYHLFHFDRDWFMDAIKPYFTVFEEFTVDAVSRFFALRPR